jgi:hypothetical protein
MRFTRAMRSLAVLLSFGFLGFAPGALAELLDDPIELGFHTLGRVNGVAVVGTLAYVADGFSGLRVIDVSDPALPVELGFLDTPDNAFGITVVGTLAYVADDSSGLRVIDSIVRVPEPGALLLGLTALGALAVLRRERPRRMEQLE